MFFYNDIIQDFLVVAIPPQTMYSENRNHFISSILKGLSEIGPYFWHDDIVYIYVCFVLDSL